MGLKILVYGILYLVTIVGALMVLFNRDTVKSAMSLILVMISLAAHYFLMGQEFVGAIQIIVYAGAIMVLFLFVIMLLNMREREISPWYLRGARFWGGAMALVFFTVLAFTISFFAAEPGNYTTSMAPSIMDLATLLTTKYFVPFLLTSVLLLVAVIGAVVMGRRFDPETGEEYIPVEEEAP